MTPGSARVLRDGAPWPEPREVWTLAATSALRVEAEGYLPLDRSWDHPVGAVHVLELALDRVPAPTPEPEPKAPPPSPAPEAAPRPPAAEARPAPSPLVPIGWTTVGAGAVGVVVGAILISLAEDSQAGLASLNASPGEAGPLYDDYVQRFRALEEQRDGRRLGGGLATGIGAAAALTGVILLLVAPTQDASGAPEASVRWDGRRVRLSAAWSF